MSAFISHSKTQNVNKKWYNIYKLCGHSKGQVAKYHNSSFVNYNNASLLMS